MGILIWGTAVRGKAVKKLCDKNGWIVSAFIDNDESKLGNLEGIPVISPGNAVIEADMQIWIATGAQEVYEQARQITLNVIKWEYVDAMLSCGEKPNFPEIALADVNIQNCKLVKDRDTMFRRFSNESCQWQMAEIGVAFGDFSEKILKICSPKKLYLIDCWNDERFGVGIENVRSKFNYEIESGIVELRQGWSTDKLEEFGDNELDLAYIDTVHDYEITKKELQLCKRKVKCQGYICGHDYTKYNTHSRCDYGVYDAVNEFAVNEGYEFIYLTLERNGLNSFCLKKI